jgi:hypothetical protein
MKKFIKWLISSSGLAWTTFIVVIAQAFHYFLFFYGFELFYGVTNYIYSIFLTIVLSLPLMIFTTKLGNIPLKFGENKFNKTEIEEKYKSGVNLYMYTDITINIYTWYIKLEVFTNFQWELLPKYIVATAVAIILPVTLKKFAGEIKLVKQ